MLDSAPIVQVLERLQEKRSQVQKELSGIPAAPSGRDVFQLCRGFERAFAYTIEVKTSLQSILHTCDLRVTDYENDYFSLYLA